MAWLNKFDALLDRQRDCWLTTLVSVNSRLHGWAHPDHVISTCTLTADRKSAIPIITEHTSKQGSAPLVSFEWQEDRGFHFGIQNSSHFYLVLLYIAVTCWHRSFWSSVPLLHNWSPPCHSRPGLLSHWMLRELMDQHCVCPYGQELAVHLTSLAVAVLFKLVIFITRWL